MRTKNCYSDVWAREKSSVLVFLFFAYYFIVRKTKFLQNYGFCKQQDNDFAKIIQCNYSTVTHLHTVIPKLIKI